VFILKTMAAWGPPHQGHRPKSFELEQIHAKTRLAY
jgi:hypothetical protein